MRIATLRRSFAQMKGRNMSTPELIDPYQRKVSYLRVSVTDRCDFRCYYCMAEEMTFLPKKELLTLEELDRMCSTFVDMGVTKLRITGGEPLVRKGIMTFFQSMSRHLKSGALKELTLTTNGSQLSRFAQPLYECGVRRINISIDTLNAKKFGEITKRGDFQKVMEGIDAADKAGLKIKLNAVALKGTNDDELHDMVEWAGKRGFDLTWIEVMPMGDMGEADRLDQYWPLSDIRKQLKDRWTVEDIPLNTGGPATYVRIKETGGRVGFITPLTHNFCESCNRVRLTCTGQLFLCLGQEDAADLRAAMRDHEGNEALISEIKAAIARKPKGHDFDYSRQVIEGEMTRHMNHTGG